MQDKIQKTINGLKDFQFATVDYVYDQLYRNGREKMLIADEVGLGKTIVAKGLLAKAFDAFCLTNPNRPFRVVYICSNQALAHQNLTKLNFTEDPTTIDYSAEDDRLTALAYEPRQQPKSGSFLIKAFTPATSFDDRTHAGRADERILLYRLLFEYADLNGMKNSLKWILKGNNRMNDENWTSRIEYAEAFHARRHNDCRQIRPSLRAAFRQSLEDEVSSENLPECFEAIGVSYKLKLWTVIRKLCELRLRQNTYLNYRFPKELIRYLRFRLSQCCLDYLDAQIFILDEFQRYKQLIDNVAADEIDKLSPAVQLARDIFKKRGIKVLMLSATPFKPYTNTHDILSGEVHHQEFNTVLRFLMGDQTSAFWESYEHDRAAFFDILRHPNRARTQFADALDTKRRLEQVYRTAMTRTERLLASGTKSTMVATQPAEISLTTDDVHDFVALDQITYYLNKEHETGLNVPLEYVKSAPFCLSFLDNYAHKEKLRRLAADDDELMKLLNGTRHAWLDMKRIEEYRALIPPRGKTLPNAKLRLLLNETVQRDGWKYLWIPPSLPYYPLEGAFKDGEGFSKTLLFSGWKLVPRMVSALVSYEAERMSVGNYLEKVQDDAEGRPSYFAPRRQPRPQLTFKVDTSDHESKQMNNFSLFYPCVALAQIVDPSRNIQDKLSFKKLWSAIRASISAMLEEANLDRFVTGKGDGRKWFWMAPLLLDRCDANEHIMSQWFQQEYPGLDEGEGSEDISTKHEEGVGRREHFKYARQVFSSDGNISAPFLQGSLLEQVIDHLVDLALGSPSVAFLRTLLRDEAPALNVLNAAFHVGEAFVTLFNKPESVAVVRLETSMREEYWKCCLKYAMDGNLQAVFDEYVYLLKDGENISAATELANHISDVVSIRTVSVETEGLREFHAKIRGQQPRRQSMRGHYALDFGNQKLTTTRTTGRLVNIRQAFNSPFRPFVLATTSIGQEGLDFHFYCRKIFHWNLPSNPVDLEQREGRINRYKGFVIRQNLAQRYRGQLTGDGFAGVWDELFACAQAERASAAFPCDLVPFWHVDCRNGPSIERFVPLYPFSRDNARYERLRQVLAYYRLAFGQPRQDDLIEALHLGDFNEQEREQLYQLLVDLCPLSFMNESSKTEISDVVSIWAENGVLTEPKVRNTV